MEKSGQGNDFWYITYALSDTLHKSIRNNALCELGSNWDEPEKFHLHATEDACQMMFAVLRNTILSELGVEQPKALGPVLIDLDNKKTSL